MCRVVDRIGCLSFCVDEVDGVVARAEGYAQEKANYCLCHHVPFWQFGGWIANIIISSFTVQVFSLPIWRRRTPRKRGLCTPKGQGLFRKASFRMHLAKLLYDNSYAGSFGFFLIIFEDQTITLVVCLTRGEIRHDDAGYRISDTLHCALQIVGIVFLLLDGWVVFSLQRYVARGFEIRLMDDEGGLDDAAVRAVSCINFRPVIVFVGGLND